MLNFKTSDISCLKMSVSNGALPAYIETQQPPSRKKPFSTILNQSFTHAVSEKMRLMGSIWLRWLPQVELLLPEELYDLIWQDVSSKTSSLEYSRVIMSLSEILDGDFFNKYIKAGTIHSPYEGCHWLILMHLSILGNILMLSEGRPGIDNQYMLKDGTYQPLGH